MLCTYTRPLSDKELRAHLLSRDHLVLKVPNLRWQEVERQVERLGFGDTFFVAETKSSRGQCCRIDPVSGGANSRAEVLITQPTIDR